MSQAIIEELIIKAQEQ
jgi:hypothetical protein